MTQCPTREQIERILTDEVSEPDGNAIAAHVQECPSCQAMMAQLAAASATTDEWVATTPAEQVLSEEDQELLRKLRDAPAPRPDQVLAFPTDSGGSIHATLPEIPGYEIRKEIGRGGMGVVYKAIQISLNRVVALKMLLGAGFASAADVKRFRTEAEAAAGLQHANIVAVHEVAEHVGRHYIVMEYVEGTSLSALVSPTPLPPQRAARYIKTVAEAIHYAHERGVLHRDLKPSNVLIDAADQPRVTDFGLAKRVDVPSDLTATGQILGTPGYMPPEQASGKRGELGRASDVYSIGATLYELLTARPPFRAATTFDTLMQTIQVEPVSPRALNAQVDRDLETITLKCLAKEQRQRYQIAAELAADLGRWLAREPIRARPVSPAARMWRWSRRNPLVAALSGLVAVLLVTVAVGAMFAYVWEANRRRHAVAELARSVLERGQAEAEAGELSAGLLHMAQALSTLADGEPDLAWVIRGNLAGWTSEFRPAGIVLQHPEQTRAVAFAPDGTKLLTGCGDGKARLWDLAKRQPSIEVECKGGVHSVAISVDGRRFATGGMHATTIWDTATGEATTPPLEHPGTVYAIAFSPDGKRLLTGCGDGGVRLWDVERHVVIREWKHGGIVYSVAFHRTGRFAITASADHTARIWAVETGNGLGTFRHMTLALQAAFWNDQHIVTTAVGIAQPWHLGDLRPMSPVFPHGGALWGLAISPDRISIVTGSDDKTVRVWNSQTGIQTGIFHHEGDVRAVAISPDGATVASASDDRTVRTWPVPDAQNPQRRTIAHRNQIKSKSFSPDGRRLLTASLDHTAAIWDTETGQLVKTFPHNDPVHFATFNTDASVVLTVATARKVVRLLDASNGKLLREFKHDQEVSDPAFRPDSSQFATGCADGVVRVWDAADGRLVATMEHDGAPAVSWRHGVRTHASGSQTTASYSPHYVTPGRFGLSLGVGMV